MTSAVSLPSTRDEQHEARVPLDERRDVAVRGAGEQSPSQWPGTARSSASAGRSRIETASTIWPLAVDAARLSRGRRDRCRSGAGGDELALQRPRAWMNKRQVDRLVRHPHSLVLGKLRSQPARDLLRRPVLPQLRRDQAAQDRVASELAALRPPCRSQARRSASAARYRRRPPWRSSSRVTVEGDRPRPPAILLADSPAATPREISSRSCERQRERLRRRSARGHATMLDGSCSGSCAGARSSARPISLTDSPRFQRSHNSRRSRAVYFLRLLATTTPPARQTNRCCADGLTAPTVTWLRALRRQAVDRPRVRGREELAGSVLAERRQIGDLEALLAEARRLPVGDHEAPDDPTAVVAVDVAAPQRRVRARGRRSRP